MTWSFDESGILRISGTGDMYDYGSSSNKAPWLTTAIMNALKSVIIKSGVTKIGEYAFTSCSNAMSVWIPDSVVSIGKFAFFGCKGLEKVTIPEGVTSIGVDAFYQCTGNSSIEIPSSVESIGNLAFSECTGLTDFTVDSENATYSAVEGVLFNKDQTELVCCPAGKEGLYSVPDGVVKIGSFAFRGCSGLTGVSIPTGVSEIGGYAFGKCTGLTSMVIPSSVTQIGSYVSNGCSNLSVIYFIGTEEEWNSISIDSSNSELLGAEIVYVDDAKSMSYAEVTQISDMQYTGREIKPDFEVHHLCTVLEEGKDYEVSYFGNVNAGTASVKISGAGEYTGSVWASFKISPVSIEGADVSGVSNMTYNGSAQKPVPVVRIGFKVLKYGTDYYYYDNNTNAGTAAITITGMGNYTGSISREFLILPGKTTRGDMFNLANNVKVTWKAVPGAKYYKVYRTGVTDSGESLSEPVIVTSGLVGWDKQPGLTNGHAYRYKIVASLTGKGDSSGDSTLSYFKLMYRLKTVVIRSAKNTAAGKVTVKYDKTTSGDSYVLQYGTRKDMVGAKTKVVKGAGNTSYTIGGLTKGKTYYISIRVRKKVNGISYYTTFGVARAVKVTK